MFVAEPRSILPPGVLLPLTIGVAVVSAALTAVVWRYALRQGLVDVPNARSSHTIPTPRGGGLAIAIAMALGVTYLWAISAVSPHLAIAFLGGLALVAGAGWLDDHGAGPAWLRMVMQTCAAVWSVGWLGGLPDVFAGRLIIPLGVFGPGLAVIGIVWSINLYNFMDGIDGIAAGGAVVMAGFGYVIQSLGHGYALAAIAAVVGAASLGFLPWNWQRARMFMGDAGSGALGFALAFLAVAASNRGSVSVFTWATLAWVFIFDASATLFRRARRRENLVVAHRLHAFCRVTRGGYSHAQSTGTVLVVTSVCGVLALEGMLRPEWTFACFGAAVLVVGLWYFWAERVFPMYGGSADGVANTSDPRLPVLEATTPAVAPPPEPRVAATLPPGLRVGAAEARSAQRPGVGAGA